MLKVVEEFKEFAIKGNVLDMAIGVVIGSAFSKIVSSLVSDIIMPLFGSIGGIKFDGLMFEIGASQIKYGLFIQNIADFMIISISVFAFVKFVNIFKKKKEEVQQIPKKSDEVILLEQILEQIKEKN